MVLELVAHDRLRRKHDVVIHRNWKPILAGLDVGWMWDWSCTDTNTSPSASTDEPFGDYRREPFGVERDGARLSVTVFLVLWLRQRERVGSRPQSRRQRPGDPDRGVRGD